jgi:hypothetical protein
MCELDFQHISMPCCPTPEVWFWEGLQKTQLNNTFYRGALQSVSVECRGSILMMVERRDVTGAFGLFLNITILQSIPLHCIVRKFSENDS